MSIYIFIYLYPVNLFQKNKIVEEKCHWIKYHLIFRIYNKINFHLF